MPDKENNHCQTNHVRRGSGSVGRGGHLPGRRGRVIIATDRRVGFREAAGSARTMDYPFTLIEMRLDKEGKGEGHIAMATKISVTGTAARIKMSAYYEFDFLGAAPTANEVESNSFNIRQRQLWAQVNLDGGFSFTGGQTWSLITLNRAGIAPRAEWIPQTIDAQYAVGFNWTRQWSARVAQKFGGGGLWLQHQPEPTSPSSQIVVSSTPGANGVSTDVAPDLVGKIAFEPGRGHHEIKGLLRP